MEDGDLDAFVERTRSVVAQSPELSTRNTELRIVLPFLGTLGWDIHGPELVAEYVAGDADGDGATDGDDRRAGGDPSPDGEHTDASGSADAASEDPGGPDAGSTDAGSEDHPPDHGVSAPVAVDYALLFEGDPVAFVITQACGEEPSPAAGRRLTAAMDAANVDWGLLTSGRTYVFVTFEAGNTERVRCGLDELPDHASVVAHYTHRAARARHERQRDRTRRRVAERVADRRDALVASVEDALADAAGGTLADELADASAAFVDGVIDALSAGDRPTGRPPEEAPSDPGASADHDAAAASGADATAPDPDATRVDDVEPPGEQAGDLPGSAGGGDSRGSNPAAGGGERAGDTSGGDDDAALQRNDGDSEYVVRFFNDRTSVGAVGHGTPAGATAQAVEYLIEQHALDSRLNLPWGPDDEHAVVNREPVHPDGSRMAAARQLSNGYYLCTTLNADASRKVVETLADRSGLRAMFQGDW